MKIYSEEKTRKLDEEYQKIKDENPDIIWVDFAKKINSMNHPDRNFFQRKMLNEVLHQYCAGYYIYAEKDSQIYSEMKSVILNTIKLLPKDYYFWWNVYYFFTCDRKNFEKNLDEYFATSKNFFDENEFNEGMFVEDFLDVYKNAYSGFWKKISNLFKKYNVVNGEEFCNLFEDFYYNCKTNPEKENLLVNYIQDNPETILAKEFLGYIYEDKKLWYNAISIFEQIAGKSVFHYFADIYFSLAWCYGKVREHPAEEENYRKCLKENPSYDFALNNLGWSLYKQKKFADAEKIFLQCLNEERDEEEQKFSANNLVRIYLQTGEIEKAKKFIESKKCKIDKLWIKRVNNYSAKNISIDETDFDGEGSSENKKFIVNNEVKREQFTSEKILEDEIVARLESGKEIFGLNLKIYRRKGDNYGRQYPFHDGKNNRRLDILCVDEQDNFYIIELKKDSGYDDAYKQIKNYVDYFEKNRAKGKKVFGILCLNSPTEKLLQDVRKDKRIRLFEYKISYSEII